MKNILLILLLFLSGSAIAQPNVHPLCTYNTQGRSQNYNYTPEQLYVDSLLHNGGIYTSPAPTAGGSAFDSLIFINGSAPAGVFTDANTKKSVFVDPNSGYGVFTNPANGTGIFTANNSSASVFVNSGGDAYLANINVDLDNIDISTSATYESIIFLNGITETILANTASYPTSVKEVVYYALDPTTGNKLTLANLTGLNKFEYIILFGSNNPGVNLVNYKALATSQTIHCVNANGCVLYSIKL
jgi:hypothetical protein